KIRKWTDAMFIAPLDANILSMISVENRGNLVTSTLAWDSTIPLCFAPAMNPLVWENPLTFQHGNTLKDVLRYK
ncbi:hypothetical protein Angca_008320, partial [Angiostrongylus cantonensis]